MLKKVLLLLFTTSLFAAENKDCTCNTVELSTVEIIVFYSVISVGAIAIAPYVLPAGTIAAISAGVTSVAGTAVTYVVPTTVVGKVGLGITAVQLARPLVLQTTEEKLNKLLEEKASRPTRAKIES